jgi:hypothetical protein
MKPLARKKEIIASAIAIAILTAIFVPFQRAEAFTLTTTLPNATGNNTTQSAGGEKFTVSITVEAGELIPIFSIDTIIDNNLSTVKRTTFTVSGTTASYSSGALGAIKDNALTLTVPTTTEYGYAYGYGYAAAGINNPSTYSYALISPGYAYVGGNTGGYSNAVGNSVFGFVGPGTITITGYVNTGLMNPGTHTLDVIVDTNGGSAPEHLVAPQLQFTISSNPGLTTTAINPGSNISLPPITVPGSSTPITITISNVQTGGTVAAEVKSASSLQSSISGIFAATSDGPSIFNVGSSTTANSVGVIFDIDLSSVTLGAGATIDVTIPYNPAFLPTGFDENNVKFFHWNGSTWEDKTFSVDTSANTVTGRLTSLSPVVAGFTNAAPSITTSGGGGGGGSSAGGSGSSSIDLTGTYSNDHFKTHPLDKVQLQSSGFVNRNGNTIFQAASGQQITIATTFKNYQESSQKYAIIFQISNKDGYTTDIGWVTGNLDGGATTQASRSWTTEEPGSYTVKFFVWDGISNTPTPLSVTTERAFLVS